jgi:hypothetical protein
MKGLRMIRTRFNRHASRLLSFGFFLFEVSAFQISISQPTHPNVLNGYHP